MTNLETTMSIVKLTIKHFGRTYTERLGIPEITRVDETRGNDYMELCVFFGDRVFGKLRVTQTEVRKNSGKDAQIMLVKEKVRNLFETARSAVEAAA